MAKIGDKMSKFKVGDRVFLREDSHWVVIGDKCSSNPLNVIGIVLSAMQNSIGLGIRVDWENGITNSYSFHDLKLAYIPDSKLARNLYKSRIETIEGGKIYLK